MEQEFEPNIPQEEQEVPEKESYQPRPKWQVWGARAVLVFFILLVIMYYVNIARGGL